MENQLSETSQPNAYSQLSEQETKAILTPFAFKLDESLFGTPLATPWRRLVALLIDFLLIAVLSEAPGELLAIVIAISLLMLSSKKQQVKESHKTNIKGRKRRAVFRFIGIFMIFIVLLDTLPKLIEDIEQVAGTEQSSDNPSKPLNKTNQQQLADLVAQTVAMRFSGKCNDLNCWQSYFEQKLPTLANLNITKDEQSELITAAVIATNLSEEQQQQLQNHLIEQLAKLHNEMAKQQGVAKAKKVQQQIKQQQQAEPKTAAKPVYSVVELVKNLIRDLGLEFGWAAFYFTIFTSLWRGQTPGKKLMKIKVLQLDGTPLSLMDSFGRYGGYGAGVATGLLGFLQVFWDPNRQAIHDKISSTVVVKV